MKQKWNGLPEKTKIAIGVSIVGVFALLALLFAFYCVKQRRAGRRERKVEDLAYERDTAELLHYRTIMGSKTWERI